MDFDDERPTTSADATDRFDPFRPGGPARTWLILTAVAAFLGALFSAVSTSDFIEHLDRQVHSIHCSFVPGAGAQIGENGCRTVMMSPYSSLFRSSMWGGLPISLLALAVFSYLVYRSLEFAFRGGTTRKETRFLVTASLLPVLMSVIYGTIAVSKIGAICKLCTGVYVSSALMLFFSIMAHVKAGSVTEYSSEGSKYGRWFVEGVLYVFLLVGAYVVFAPTSAKTLEGCGALVKSDDPAGIIFHLEGSLQGAPSLAVIDPLCPACKAFDERLEASGFDKELSLRAVLFPLDATCNWMLKTSLHPGACAVSEAILCDKDEARRILSWAFQHQDELRASAEKTDADVRERILTTFPKVKGCLGTATAKNKVNKSLRFAVANALPILTPQLFIGDRRVCDEDTDLGLDYTITSMLKNHAHKGRADADRAASQIAAKVGP